MRKAVWAAWAVLCHSVFAYEVIMSKRTSSGQWQPLAPQEQLVAMDGGSVTLGCAVGAGDPTWKMCQWFFPTSGETGCTLFRDFNNTCDYVSLDRNLDACVITRTSGVGEWMCKLNALTAEDNFGSASISLGAVQAPGSVNLNDTQVVGRIGSVVYLAGSVSGSLAPAPALIWQLNGNAVANRTDECANANECAYTSILEYTVAAADDGSDLTCSAQQTDSFGQVVTVPSTPLPIYVTDLPVSESLSAAEIVAIVLGILLFLLLLLLLLACCVAKRRKKKKEDEAYYVYYTNPSHIEQDENPIAYINADMVSSTTSESSTPAPTPVAKLAPATPSHWRYVEQPIKMAARAPLPPPPPLPRHLDCAARDEFLHFASEGSSRGDRTLSLSSLDTDSHVDDLDLAEQFGRLGAPFLNLAAMCDGDSVCSSDTSSQSGSWRASSSSSSSASSELRPLGYESWI